jgi:hypothetical protein
MSRKRRRLKKLEKSEHIKQIAETTKQGLILSIIFLLAIILVLAFKVGEALWPVWLVESRTFIVGILSFIVIFLFLLSPIIVEFNSNPRHLSGLGRDPRFG